MGDGAFSNVYKAVERKNGRKVAVKVVRKYELNSSQVSDSSVNLLVFASIPESTSHTLAKCGIQRWKWCLSSHVLVSAQCRTAIDLY